MISRKHPSPPSSSARSGLRFGLLLSLLAVAAVVEGAGEIYKYVEEDGTITYHYLKPKNRKFEVIEPTCVSSYIGCDLSHADWRRIPLNRAAYRDQITTVAARYGIDPALVRAVVHAESNFNPRAVSRAGAQGLMQLMPANQKRFGVRNPFDVTQNLEGGTRLFKQLLEKYRYDIRLAAAAYNAGEEAVARYKGIPPYDETRNYVRRVTQLYTRYQNPS